MMASTRNESSTRINRQLIIACFTLVSDLTSVFIQSSFSSSSSSIYIYIWSGLFGRAALMRRNEMRREERRREIKSVCPYIVACLGPQRLWAWATKPRELLSIPFYPYEIMMNNRAAHSTLAARVLRKSTAWPQVLDFGHPNVVADGRMRIAS